MLIVTKIRKKCTHLNTDTSPVRCSLKHSLKIFSFNLNLNYLIGEQRFVTFGSVEVRIIVDCLLQLLLHLLFKLLLLCGSLLLLLQYLVSTSCYCDCSKKLDYFTIMKYYFYS